MRSTVLRITFAATSLAIAGCSGGSGPASRTNLPAVAVTRHAPVTVTIAWPSPRTTAATRKRPAYISAATSGITIDIDGTRAASLTNPVTAGSPPQTQSVVVEAPLGTHTFTVRSVDKNAALLGRTAVPLTVVETAANRLLLTLDGQLAKIAIVATPNALLETVSGADYTLVGPMPQTFALLPEDAGGYVIVAPGAVPSLALSQPAGVNVASTATTNVFTVQAPVPTAPVTLTASGTDLDAKAVTATVTVQALAALYVTDPRAGTVSAFDEVGRPIPLPSGAFPNVGKDTEGNGVVGLAYKPAATTDIPGTLYVTGYMNSLHAEIGTYDLLGDDLAGGSAFYTYSPQYLTYSQRNGGRFFTGDSDPGGTYVLSGYDGSGTTIFAATAATAYFSHLTSPSKIAFDDTQTSPDYYVTDAYGIHRFSNDGTFVASGPDFTTLGGIAYDSKDALFFAAAFTGTGPAQRARLLAYDKSLAAQTTTNVSPIAFAGINRATDVAYDPYNGLLYVTDFPGHAVLTFKPDGSAGGNLVAPISSVTNPLGIVIVP